MNQKTLLALTLAAGFAAYGCGSDNSTSGSSLPLARQEDAAAVRARLDPAAAYTPPATPTLVSSNPGGVASNGYQHSLSLSYTGARLAFASTANNLVPGAGDSQADRALYSGESLSGIITQQSQNPLTSTPQRYLRTDVFVKDLNTGALNWVSRPSGNSVTPDRESALPQMSDDGQSVVFRSWASLQSGVPYAANNARVCHIFQRNLSTDATLLVDVKNGTVGSDHSAAFNYLNGRYVTFTSRSRELDPSNSNGWDIAFRKDMQTGALDRLTLPSRGAYGDTALDLDLGLRKLTSVVWTPGTSNYALWSTDLQTSASALLQTGLNGPSAYSNDGPRQFSNAGVFFLRKETSSSPTLCFYNYTAGSVSTVAPTTREFVVTSGGRYVAFTTTAALLPADTSPAFDLYVKDLQTGNLALVNTPDPGGYEARRPAISGDGRTIAWIQNSSSASMKGQIYVRANPVFAGVPTPPPYPTTSPTPPPTTSPTPPPSSFNPPTWPVLVSSTAGGTSSNGYQHSLSLSYSGSRVAFASSGNNLVSGAGDSGASYSNFNGESLDGIITNSGGSTRNLKTDVFVKDITDGSLNWASRGTQAWPDRESAYPMISDDGQTVAFRSWAALMAGPNWNLPRVSRLYLRNLAAATTAMVDTTSSGAFSTAHAQGYSYTGNRYVTFTSRSRELDPGNTNGWDIAFRKDTQSGQLDRLTPASRSAYGDGSVDMDSNTRKFTSVQWTPGSSNYALWLTDLVAGTSSQLRTDLDGPSDYNNNGTRPQQFTDKGTFFLQRASVGQTYTAPTLCYLDYATNQTTVVAPTVRDYRACPSGRYVVFSTTAALDPSDQSANNDVYVRDMQTGRTLLVNQSVTTQSGYDHRCASISGDGRTVAWIRANWYQPLASDIYLTANPLTWR